MKTYEDFRAEVMERYFETPVSHAQIEELAAKEYAKQWVERCAEKAATQLAPHGVMWIDVTSIRNIKKEIDTQ